MKVSFDLDDTLICSHQFVPQETSKIPLLLKPFFKETLRLGTVDLFNQLKEMGVDICIYTTSYRSISYIKWLFRFYGFKLTLIINKDIHDQNIAKKGNRSFPSKLPCQYRIDLHVDDECSLLQDSLQYGFEVLIIKPENQDWDQKVLERIQQIMRRNKK